MKVLPKERMEKISKGMQRKIEYYLMHFVDEKETDKEIELEITYDIYSKLQAEKDEAMRALGVRVPH